MYLASAHPDSAPAAEISKPQLRVGQKGIRRHIRAFQQRRDWLRGRMAQGPAGPQISYWRDELAAVEWALEALRVVRHHNHPEYFGGTAA